MDNKETLLDDSTISAPKSMNLDPKKHPILSIFEDDAHVDLYIPFNEIDLLRFNKILMKIIIDKVNFNDFKSQKNRILFIVRSHIPIILEYLNDRKDGNFNFAETTETPENILINKLYFINNKEKFDFTKGYVYTKQDLINFLNTQWSMNKDRIVAYELADFETKVPVQYGENQKDKNYESKEADLTGDGAPSNFNESSKHHEKVKPDIQIQDQTKGKDSQTSKQENVPSDDETQAMHQTSQNTQFGDENHKECEPSEIKAEKNEPESKKPDSKAESQMESRADNEENENESNDSLSNPGFKPENEPSCEETDSQNELIVEINEKPAPEKEQNKGGLQDALDEKIIKEEKLSDDAAVDIEGGDEKADKSADEKADKSGDEKADDSVLTPEKQIESGAEESKKIEQESVSNDDESMAQENTSSDNISESKNNNKRKNNELDMQDDEKTEQVHKKARTARSDTELEIDDSEIRTFRSGKKVAKSLGVNENALSEEKEQTPPETEEKDDEDKRSKTKPETSSDAPRRSLRKTTLNVAKEQETQSDSDKESVKSTQAPAVGKKKEKQEPTKESSPPLRTRRSLRSRK